LARQVFSADNPNLTLFINQAAALHEALGHPAEAESLYSEALLLAEGTLGPRHPLVAQVLHDIGALRFASGRVVEARAALKRALAIQEERFGPDKPATAVTRLSLVRCLERDSTLAETAVSIELDRTIVALESSDAFLESRVDAYTLRAERSDRRGDRDSAIGDLAKAVALLDTLRRVRGGGDDVRTKFFADRQRIFDQMVAWWIERDDVARAFEVHERSRARQLLDEIDGAGVDLRAGIPADALAAFDADERAARHRLATTQRQLEDLQRDPKPTPAQRLEIIERLSSARDSAAWRLQRSRQSAKERSPIWRDVLSDAGVVTSLEEVQRRLVTPGRVGLIYRIGEHRSYFRHPTRATTSPCDRPHDGLRGCAGAWRIGGSSHGERSGAHLRQRSDTTEAAGARGALRAARRLGDLR
jgi:tetratricopeptide (TPR) repeat protein